MATDLDQTAFPPFTVTRTAIDELSALGGAVRVDLEDGGCCGTAYVFNQVDSAAPEAAGGTAYGCPGAWLIVSDAAAAVLPGSTLDYSERLKPPRFRIIGNPNTERVCVCRRSFGQPWPGPGQPTCRSYQPMPWDTTYDPPGRGSDALAIERPNARRTNSWADLVRRVPGPGSPPLRSVSTERLSSRCSEPT